VIRALLVLCCACLALVAGEAPLGPHQGTVVLAERSFADVWIISETTDGVGHTLDDKKDSPPTTLNRGKYVRVDYNRPQDVPWLRGDAAAAKADWATAATQFLEATKSRESWYTRESAFLRAAEALLQAGRADDAVKALDGLVAQFPKSASQARITYLRAQVLQKKGDNAGALKAYAVLAGKAEWGISAIALGTTGQAEILAADKKHDEAAKVLGAAFVKLDAVKDAELFSQVGVALAQQQQAAGQNPAAIATLRRLAYGAGDATGRARAHVAWAQVLVALGDPASLFEAFDHAAMADAERGADPTVTGQGAQLMRQITGRIDKLAPDQASDALKAEYRRYISR
jgi:hypothetical protein